MPTRFSTTIAIEGDMIHRAGADHVEGRKDLSGIGRPNASRVSVNHVRLLARLPRPKPGKDRNERDRRNQRGRPLGPLPEYLPQRDHQRIWDIQRAQRAWWALVPRPEVR